MADAAAARREARRKRILENSHNRLQLISGKNDESCRESTNKSPIPQIFETRIEENVNEPSSFSLLNGVLGNEPELSQSLPSRHDVVAAGDGEVVNDFAAFGSSPAPDQAQPPLWITLITYKYDILFLSLLLQIVYGLSSVDFENNYFFLPLFIYTATKIIWFPDQNNSSIANILLLLNGMNAVRVQRILKILQITGTISQDVSIYLFTTICTQSIVNILRDSFVT